MRLTRAGEYGVRCILYLAGQEAGRVIPRKEIAETMDIPHPFLGKIAQTLAAAGIIHIIQGARGGYQLARPASRITLLEVVEAMEGGIVLNDCVIRPGSCQFNSTCSVHRVWSKARDQLRQTLEAANFADLAEDACIFEAAS